MLLQMLRATKYPNDGYKTQYTGKQFKGNKHPRQILGPKFKV